MNAIEIRLARVEDLALYRDHLRRHSLESGRDGNIIFAPEEDPWDAPLNVLQKEKTAKWEKAPHEIGWERCWIAIDGSHIRGALILAQFIPLKSALHRATLMMGIEKSHRRSGLGSRLVSEAVRWARAQPGLDWLQLQVFSHNEAAIKLYKKFGFQEQGTIPDLFRVFGQKISDTQMALKLR